MGYVNHALGKHVPDQEVRLGYTGNGSDKVYIVTLKDTVEGWEVHCKYGKRYNANNSALKTKIPLDYYQAEEIFNKTVDQKLAKGYQLE